MSLICNFLLAFGLTVGIECGIAALLCRRRDVVWACFLGNLLTNPALNFLLLLCALCFGAGAYWPALLLLEALAVFAEAWTYRWVCGFSKMRAAGLSLLCNGVSLAFGVVLLW